MSHAEALQTLHPAAGATEAVVAFVGRAAPMTTMTDEVRHYARRHLLDTIGVMIAGAGGEVATPGRGRAGGGAAGRPRAGAPAARAAPT